MMLPSDTFKPARPLRVNWFNRAWTPSISACPSSVRGISNFEFLHFRISGNGHYELLNCRWPSGERGLIAPTAEIFHANLNRFPASNRPLGNKPMIKSITLPGRGAQSRGFTLIELLVVIAIHRDIGRAADPARRFPQPSATLKIAQAKTGNPESGFRHQPIRHDLQPACRFLTRRRMRRTLILLLVR